MLKGIQVIFHLLVLASISLGENQQSWSHHTYNDEPFTLKCDSGKYTITSTDVITWDRHGHNVDLMSDARFEMRSQGGIANAELHLKKVTNDLHGIYICHIKDLNQDHMESVVQGLNVGTRLYKDDIDKYRDNIIIGVIAGGAVFVLIISVCLMDHFRYLSEESLEKRRYRKELRLRQKTNGFKSQSYDNPGVEMTEGNRNNSSNVMESSYVHF